MVSEVTTAEKIRRLPWNTFFAATNNVFAVLTFWGSSFILFLNELNATNSQIGLLLAMIPFTGLVALFIAPQVARFGYKRTFITFYVIRTVIVSGLLFVPFVLENFGGPAALLLVMLVTFGFSLSRSIAETGYYPWSQEFIPNAIRGKHSAINDMLARITGITATIFSGYVIGLSLNIDRYMILFIVALVFSVVAAWALMRLPGGAPADAPPLSLRRLFGVFRDKNFSWYLAGICMVTFGGAPLSFLPLFMQSQLGFNDSMIVWLGIGGTLGGLSATYLMGWAADRYGSKPVLLLGLYIKAFIPLAWLFVPHSEGLPFALLLWVITGIVDIGWVIGSGRLLFTTIVPHEKRGEYMALYYASIGLIGGISQILSGALLDITAGLNGVTLWIFPIDQFTPLFVGAMVLMLGGAWIFKSVNADSNVSVSEFASMFIHGNPFSALTSLTGYYRAKDERSMVEITERMGKTRSLLTVEELLEALVDPRFNVRFEAILAIARMGPEPRLIDAMTRIVDGTELSLSVIAAWALGRMGGTRGIPSLRQGLRSPYRSIQAHCARSLGTLGDIESAPFMFKRLQEESDIGLRMALASALGKMAYAPALPMLLDMLNAVGNEGARMELALAVARQVDGEQPFIQLLRGLRGDLGTSTSQAIDGLKKLDKTMPQDVRALIDTCAHSFARDQYDLGSVEMAQLIAVLVERGAYHGVHQQILEECAAKLRIYGVSRREYLVLALVTFRMMEHD